MPLAAGSPAGPSPPGVETAADGLLNDDLHAAGEAYPSRAVGQRLTQGALTQLRIVPTQAMRLVADLLVG